LLKCQTTHKGGPKRFCSDTFRGHPSKNPILGTKKTVCKLTFSDLLEAYEKYYIPQNTILTLSGMFSQEDFVTVLEGYYAIKARSSFSKKKESIGDIAPKRVVSTAKQGIAQAYLSFGLLMSSITNAD
jgi:predicted Zn-dependent peptidase